MSKIIDWFKHYFAVPQQEMPRLARRLAREGQYQDAWEAMAEAKGEK